MDKIRTVLYGSDLVVSTVGENLRGREGFQILQMGRYSPVPCKDWTQPGRT